MDAVSSFLPSAPARRQKGIACRGGNWYAGASNRLCVPARRRTRRPPARRQDCGDAGCVMIHAAGYGDIPALNAIELAAAALFPPGMLPDAVLRECVPAAVLARAVAEGRLWVDRDACRRITGYAFWERIDGAALLAQIDVLPAYGRRGIGTSLVRHILGQAGQAGLPHVYLTTFSTVAWNMPLYRKLGFVCIAAAEQPGFLRKILEDERKRGLEHRVAMRATTADGHA